MVRSRIPCLVLALVLVAQSLQAQISVRDHYLVLNARGDDPLFTTYAAPMERSRFFEDKAYFEDEGRDISG